LLYIHLSTHLHLYMGITHLLYTNELMSDKT
jgi:hypothetical protein